MISAGSITSRASIASTPARVVSVPPSFTVGRFQRRKATVTSPRPMASRVGIGNCIRQPIDEEDGDPVARRPEHDEGVEHLVVAEDGGPRVGPLHRVDRRAEAVADAADGEHRQLGGGERAQVRRQVEHDLPAGHHVDDSDER